MIKLIKLVPLLILASIAGAQTNGKTCLPWAWIIPLGTDRSEIERAFGPAVSKDRTNPYQTYEAPFGRINILFAPEKRFYPEYERALKQGTVLNYFVSPKAMINLSDLPYDLSRYKRDSSNSPREISYFSEDTGILVVTGIVSDDSKVSREIVRNIEYRSRILRQPLK